MPEGDGAVLWLYATARGAIANATRRQQHRIRLSQRAATELNRAAVAEARTAPPTRTRFSATDLWGCWTMRTRDSSCWQLGRASAPINLGACSNCSPAAARVRLHHARAASGCAGPGGLAHRRNVKPPATEVDEMDEIQLLRTLDPVTAENVDAFPALEVFEQLSAQLAEVPAGAARTATPIGDVRRRPERGGHRLALRSLAGAVAVAAVALAASLALTESVAPSPTVGLRRRDQPYLAQVPGRSSPGILTCPSATTCYATGPKRSRSPGTAGTPGTTHWPKAGCYSAAWLARALRTAPYLESARGASRCSSRPPTLARPGRRAPGPAGLSMDHQFRQRNP